jgi:hypothetical protein
LDGALNEQAKGEGENIDRIEEKRAADEAKSTDKKMLTESAKKVGDESRVTEGRGRARRLSRLDLEREKIAAPAPLGAVAGTPADKPGEVLGRAQLGRGRAEGAAAAAENLQILFVISHERPLEAAASAPAEASPPAEKASK